MEKICFELFSFGRYYFENIYRSYEKKKIYCHKRREFANKLIQITFYSAICPIFFAFGKQARQNNLSPMPDVK